MVRRLVLFFTFLCAIWYVRMMLNSSPVASDVSKHQYTRDEPGWDASKQRYKYGVADSLVGLVSEQRDLVPVIPYNNDIIWGSQDKISLDATDSVQQRTQVRAISLVPLKYVPWWVYTSDREECWSENGRYQTGCVLNGLTEADRNQLSRISPHPIVRSSNKSPFDNRRNKPLSLEFWCTMAPELLLRLMRTRYHGRSNDMTAGDMYPHIAQRVAEILGLHPDCWERSCSDPAERRVVMEFLVSPTNLVRPSRDSEVFDSTVVLPSSGQSSPLRTFGLRSTIVTDLIDPDMLHSLRAKTSVVTSKISSPVGGASAHASFGTWFSHNVNSNKHPWTAQGYSYDYGAQALATDEHYGCSEFLLGKDAVFFVTGCFSLETYFTMENVNEHVCALIDQYKAAEKSLCSLRAGYLERASQSVHDAATAVSLVSMLYATAKMAFRSNEVIQKLLPGSPASEALKTIAHRLHSHARDTQANIMERWSEAEAQPPVQAAAA